MAPEYSSQTYWDERYQTDPITFEWYHGFENLQRILLHYIPTHARILQVWYCMHACTLHDAIPVPLAGGCWHV